MGPIREHLVVRGQGNLDIEVRNSKWREVFGHKGSKMWSEDKCLFGLTEQRSERLTCRQQQHFR